MWLHLKPNALWTLVFCFNIGVLGEGTKYTAESKLAHPAEYLISIIILIHNSFFEDRPGSGWVTWTCSRK